jgi:hypothetical protein
MADEMELPTYGQATGKVPVSSRPKKNVKLYVCLLMLLLMLLLLCLGIFLMIGGELGAQKDYERHKLEFNTFQLSEANSQFDTMELCRCTLQPGATSTFVDCASDSFMTYHDFTSGTERPFACFRYSEDGVYFGTKSQWVSQYMQEHGENRDFEMTTWISPIRTMTWIGIPLFFISLIGTIISCCCLFCTRN